jgi:hypothetical protein
MHADVHLVRDLLVVQPLGGQFRDGALGAGQALPPRDRPLGWGRPAASRAERGERGEPMAYPRRVGDRAGQLVSAQGLREVVDRPVLVRLPDR